MAMRDPGRVLVDTCNSWGVGDLPGVLAHFRDDVVFSVHGRPNAASLVGEGVGKVLFARRLEALLDEFEVLEFELHGLSTDRIWHYTRVRYRYRHHASRLTIDGSMRHKWAFVGDQVAYFELFHDADRMNAFLRMAALAACDS